MSHHSDIHTIISCTYRRLKNRVLGHEDLKESHTRKLAELGEDVNSYCYKSTVIKHQLWEGQDEVEFYNDWEPEGLASFQDRKEEEDEKRRKSPRAYLQRFRDRVMRLFQRPDIQVLFPNFHRVRRSSNIHATWMGHSCVYLEFWITGLRVLCDPVFEKRCEYRGVKTSRVTKPPCKIEDIPFIDIVIISNSHPEHLCYFTIKKIHKIHPFCQYIVPLGCSDWFTENGITQVTELAWGDKGYFNAVPYARPGDSTPVPDVRHIEATITCLPCQYSSPRGQPDRSKGLWASWWINCELFNVYFCGATGYRVPDDPEYSDDDISSSFENRPYCNSISEIFQDNGSMICPLDFVCLLIGGYSLRALRSGRNCDSDDAVCVFKDLRAEFGLAIGWGTWSTTKKEMERTRLQLLESTMRWGVKPGTFNVTNIGQTGGYQGPPVAWQPFLRSRSQWVEFEKEEAEQAKFLRRGQIFNPNKTK